MKTAINSLTDLTTALNSATALELELQVSVMCPYSLILPTGFSLTGADRDKCILSFSNSDGIGLTANNTIANLNIQTNPGNRAVYALSNYADLGTLRLVNLTVTGQVQILTRAGTNNTVLVAYNVDIVSCDSRRYSEQPQKYGVNVYQGAFTVYNYNSDTNSNIHATLTNISLGRKGAPVLGSGLFVGGYGDNGGWVKADNITTGDIYTNGMLPFGQADMITGAVVISNGATVQNLNNQGTVTTYGVNDMALDAWGSVANWVVDKPVTTYGPSSIGLVNFGTIGRFEAKDKIETFGMGSRGFNQYDGTVTEAIFHSITTHGNGSMGIQISRPVGTITVKHDVTTNGAEGQSLVKGVITTLPADGVNIKQGANIKQLNISGGITTHGDAVHSYIVDDGIVQELNVSGNIKATGEDAYAVTVRNSGKTPLIDVIARSENGIAVLIDHATVTDRSGLIAHGGKGNIVEIV